MKIRSVKPGHTTYCTWCKANHVQNVCVYHLTGANKQSCVDHLRELERIKDQHEAADKNHFSEADYQSWLKL